MTYGGWGGGYCCGCGGYGGCGGDGGDGASGGGGGGGGGCWSCCGWGYCCGGGSGYCHGCGSCCGGGYCGGWSGGSCCGLGGGSCCGSGSWLSGSDIDGLSRVGMVPEVDAPAVGAVHITRDAYAADHGSRPEGGHHPRRSHRGAADPVPTRN